MKINKNKIIILLLTLLFTTACNNKNMEGMHILTTIYPISYITNEIYDQGIINSIYPNGADVNNYNLTDKQIKEYSHNDIFIYNGLSNELNTAKNLINSNRKLKVIDIAYGLNFKNGLEELWLSPNYFLMLATTIKDNLKDFTDSKYANEEIEKKYNTLAETISVMDAELRNIARSAKNINKNTIIVSSNMFKYLNNYGFNVISLEDEENLGNANLNSIKNGFKEGIYTTIFMKDTENKNELISFLEKNYNAKIITINTMTTLSQENENNNDNYITIMNNYIDEIKNATLGE